ncbi:MAG: hypothetical protein WCE21_00490 [Candidatus Babeliales bacterium]
MKKQLFLSLVLMIGASIGTAAMESAPKSLTTKENTDFLTQINNATTLDEMHQIQQQIRQELNADSTVTVPTTKPFVHPRLIEQTLMHCVEQKKQQISNPQPVQTQTPIRNQNIQRKLIFPPKPANDNN